MKDSIKKIRAAIQKAESAAAEVDTLLSTEAERVAGDTGLSKDRATAILQEASTSTATPADAAAEGEAEAEAATGGEGEGEGEGESAPEGEGESTPEGEGEGEGESESEGGSNGDTPPGTSHGFQRWWRGG